MKKLIFALFCVAGLATTSNAQIAVAPELGLNITSMNMKVTDLAGGSFIYNTVGKAGPALGAVADIAIAGSIYFQPGIFYEMNGCKFKLSYEHPAGRWDIGTIKVPLNFEYKTGEKGGNRFFVGVGPYIGYNVSATYNYEESTGYPLVSLASSGVLKIGSGPGNYITAIDFGLGVNVGYQFANGLFVRVHGQKGFTNLDPYADAHDSYKTEAAGISVGYFFLREKADGKKQG